jgi:lipid A 4'-phosphatase
MEPQVKRKLQKDIIAYLSIFISLSCIFWFSDLDIKLQRLFYYDKDGWILRDHPFWYVIYNYGVFPGYFLAVLSLFLLSWSYWKAAYARWRKLAVLMIFTIALGPGLLVNATFKDHWGRPRPREIKEFGGNHQFLHAWQMGDSGGKSFPCGHCSMAFYFMVPYLFFRNRKKRVAMGFLLFGLMYGLLVGIARMVAGAHFASDVVWSAGMVWLSGLIIHYLFRVYNNPSITSKTTARDAKKAKLVTIGAGIFLPVLTVSLLLATPYISSKHFSRDVAELHDISVILVEPGYGNLKIEHDKDFRVHYDVTGFGFPNSKIRKYWRISGDTARYYLEQTGWFTEVRNNIKVGFPASSGKELIVSVKKGDVTFDLSENSSRFTANIHIAKGDVHIETKNCRAFMMKHNVPETRCHINAPDIYSSPGTIRKGKTPLCRINIQLGDGQINLY